ncbi:L-lactate permease [Staphylococcus aureus]|nr:L-lactate permease [Staphylococcus aureus]
MTLLTVNPFDNVGLSALVAAVPIILFLLCLTVFKMKGIYAALTTLVVTLIVAFYLYLNYQRVYQQVRLQKALLPVFSQ